MNTMLDDVTARYLLRRHKKQLNTLIKIIIGTNTAHQRRHLVDDIIRPLYDVQPQRHAATSRLDTRICPLRHAASALMQLQHSTASQHARGDTLTNALDSHQLFMKHKNKYQQHRRYILVVILERSYITKSFSKSLRSISGSEHLPALVTLTCSHLVPLRTSLCLVKRIENLEKLFTGFYSPYCTQYETATIIAHILPASFQFLPLQILIIKFTVKSSHKNDKQLRYAMLPLQLTGYMPDPIFVTPPIDLTQLINLVTPAFSHSYHHVFPGYNQVQLSSFHTFPIFFSNYPRVNLIQQLFFLTYYHAYPSKQF